MDNVIGNGDISFFIAKVCARLAHAWVMLIIARGKLSVLKMYLFEFTSTKCNSVTHDPYTD
jgi:hypothetical protein